jgi:hypothetical protein
MIMDDPKFSIVYSIGGFGNHVRWLSLLDNRYQCVIKASNFQHPSEQWKINPIESYKFYDFVSMDTKLEFIKTWVYPDRRTWHNWLIFEWKYREQLNEILPVTHEYKFNRPGGPQRKELYLRVTPDLAYRCFLKFNTSLNNTSPAWMKSAISEFNQVTERYCLEFNKDTLYLDVDSLYNEQLDRELYQQLINFFELDDNYEVANQVHKVWYNLHRKAEKEIITDLQKIYTKESL